MNKIVDLHILLYDENPDILGTSESWTHEGILDAELTYDGYTLFRCDRPMDNRGGGVLLYVYEVNFSHVNIIHSPSFLNKFGVS